MTRSTVKEVIPSGQARSQLPGIIDELVKNPGQTVEVGRQRKREVVLLSASHFDQIMEVNDLARDLAWTEFARERIENPTSAPVSWEDAQRRRRP